MTKWWTIYLALLLVVIGAIGAMAVENKGAAEIELNGGKRGTITFPHHQHQKTLGDCKICHKLFAQKKGSIDQLKESGKLTKKEVMNKLCIHCHKERKRSGQPSGPVTCTKCHKKE